MCERTTDSIDGVSYAFARHLTHMCYKHYATHLSKNGKPQRNCEWTSVAAVVQSVHSEEGIFVRNPFLIFVIYCYAKLLTQYGVLPM